MYVSFYGSVKLHFKSSISEKLASMKLLKTARPANGQVCLRRTDTQPNPTWFQSVPWRVQTSKWLAEYGGKCRPTETHGSRLSKSTVPDWPRYQESIWIWISEKFKYLWNIFFIIKYFNLFRYLYSHSR